MLFRGYKVLSLGEDRDRVALQGHLQCRLRQLGLLRVVMQPFQRLSLRLSIPTTFKVLGEWTSEKNTALATMSLVDLRSLDRELTQKFSLFFRKVRAFLEKYAKLLPHSKQLLGPLLADGGTLSLCRDAFSQASTGADSNTRIMDFSQDVISVCHRLTEVFSTESYALGRLDLLAARLRALSISDANVDRLLAAQKTVYLAWRLREFAMEKVNTLADMPPLSKALLGADVPFLMKSLQKSFDSEWGTHVDRWAYYHVVLLFNQQNDSPQDFRVNRVLQDASNLAQAYRDDARACFAMVKQFAEAQPWDSVLGKIRLYEALQPTSYQETMPFLGEVDISDDGMQVLFESFLRLCKRIELLRSFDQSVLEDPAWMMMLPSREAWQFRKEGIYAKEDFAFQSSIGDISFFETLLKGDRDGKDLLRLIDALSDRYLQRIRAVEQRILVSSSSWLPEFRRVVSVATFAAYRWSSALVNVGVPVCTGMLQMALSGMGRRLPASVQRVTSQMPSLFSVSRFLDGQFGRVVDPVSRCVGFERGPRLSEVATLTGAMAGLYLLVPLSAMIMAALMQGVTMPAISRMIESSIRPALNDEAASCGAGNLQRMTSQQWTRVLMFGLSAGSMSSANLLISGGTAIFSDQVLDPVNVRALRLLGVLDRDQQQALLLVLYQAGAGNTAASLRQILPEIELLIYRSLRL